MHEISTAEPVGYAEFLAELKQRIERAQLRASLAVNRELVLLYWQIGREILSRQDQESWGAKVIDRLAADLKRSFPDMRGFSPRNLKYMRAFAEAWADEKFVQAVLAQITWYHNIALLEKTPDSRGSRLVCARNGPARLEQKCSCSPNRVYPSSAPGPGSDQLRSDSSIAAI